jgi:HEAT repeat protein
LREPKLVKGTQWGYIGFLGTHAARHPAAIETIAHVMLTCEHFTVRAHAANVLEEMGAAARSALPQLRRAALDEWLTVRDAATNAIVRIESHPGKRKP